MENISGQVIKGYELQERIGAGGFGAVYRAFQSTVAREVAVKIILPGYANQPDFIRRFESEAQIITRLEHLHIVPLYDYWREPDGAYLVMRWMRGGSLRDMLARDGAFNLEKAGQVLDQIAAGLALAHRHQVIHRDLKPGNILLDEEGNAYLADFGIAKDTTQSGTGDTEADMVIGSPDYLSPEQARSEPVTPQTDVYSLGVVLYEMLAGEHPFPRLSPVERLYKHLSERLPFIATLPADNVEAINEVIQKATAKNPNHRYEDTLAMAAAFRAAAALDSTVGEGSIVEMLTRRDQEILHYIIEGRTNKEIADRLFVTVATVKWYITQIYRKLGVRSRMQAIVRARELNLVVSPNHDNDNYPAFEAATVIPTDQFQPDNPYKGLRAFESADFGDFFGRERLVQRLVKRLSEDGNAARFLAIVGPSGSGKSSLVKAGLIPALWRGEIPNSEKWFIVDMVPGTRPLDELEIALTRVASTQPGNLHEHLERDDHGLLRATKLVLPDDDSELVLIIDQFEEVFTLVEDEVQRIHFLKLLHVAVTEHRSRVRVILTLRADFYDRPLHYPDFGELVRTRMETVLPLGATELEHAIVNPAKRVGVSFEQGLVEAIIDQVHYQAGALPLLQYALTELFEQRQGRQLTHTAYEDIGKVTGALAKQAEDLYRESNEAGREAIRQMFLRLVTLGEGVEDTRRRVARSELLALAPNPDLMDEVIDTFAAYRLLSLDHNPATRRPTVEVAHEVLLREWTRLESWLSESRQDILLQRQLLHLSQDWEDNRQDSSYLLRGSRLVQFEAFSQQTQLALTPLESTYLHASLSNREQERAAEEERQIKEAKLEKRAQNFLRGLVAVLLVSTLIGFGLSAAAITQRGIAQDNEAAAERSAEISQSLALASAAQAALSNGNVDLALALASAATQIDSPPAFAGRILFDTTSTPGTMSEFVGGGGWLLSLDVSPDHQRIVSGGDEILVIVSDIQTRQEVMRITDKHTQGIANTKFTPDGKSILVSSWDDQIILWDIETGRPIWETFNPAGDPNSSDISPDGSLLVVGSEGGVVTLFDMQTGEYLGELTGHDPSVQVQGATFSPDGRLVAAGSEDATIIIWDVESYEIVHRLEGHTDIVLGIAFSPDGKTLASVGFDKRINLWDVESGTLIRSLAGHTDFVFDVAWNRDGTQLISTSRDSTLKLWDAATGQLLHTYSDETARTLSVTFLDDQHVVSSSSSGKLRIWSLFDERETNLIQFDGVYSLINNEAFTAIGTENAVVLLDGESHSEVTRFIYEGGEASGLAFSPDGRFLFGGFQDSMIVQWNIETGEEIRRFEGHTAIVINEDVQFGSVQSLAISPDGRYLLSAGEERRLILWDIEADIPVWEFESPSDTINAAAFSPDGDTFAAGFGSLVFPTQSEIPERDYTIHLWNTESHEEIRRFEGHEGAITAIQFSPDGKTLVSGAIDETLRLWDVASGRELRRFDGHTGGILSLDFSTDSGFIISGAQDSTVNIWDVLTGDLLRQFAGHEAVITAVAFDNTDMVWSASQDGVVYQWKPLLDLQTLREWTAAKRYVRDLTCSEQTLYLLVSACEEAK